jgi:membrane protease YdiL (CAAX protease family)
MRWLERRSAGYEIAFLVFAIVFLAYPVQKYVAPFLGLSADDSALVGRLFIFVPAVLMLFAVPVFREFSLQELATPIARDRRLEVAVVAFAKVLVPFAIFGGFAVWWWLRGGEPGLARFVGNIAPMETQLARALTFEGLLWLVLTGSLGPIVEELLFRGLLFRAWEARWGWFPAMIATSLMFALFHGAAVPAFLGSLVFVAVYMRTGSLWAPIVVHAVGNIALWPPLMGQFYMRTAGKETGELAAWMPNLFALCAYAIALVVYVWMARTTARVAADDPSEVVTDDARAAC